MGNFIVFMNQVIDQFKKNGNAGTAHVYESTLNAVVVFRGTGYMSF